MQHPLRYFDLISITTSRPDYTANLLDRSSPCLPAIRGVSLSSVRNVCMYVKGDACESRKTEGFLSQTDMDRNAPPKKNGMSMTLNKLGLAGISGACSKGCMDCN